MQHYAFYITSCNHLEAAFQLILATHKQHTISHIFLREEAVLSIKTTSSKNQITKWREIIETLEHTKFQCCSKSCHEFSLSEKDNTLIPGFTISGLGQAALAMSETAKWIQIP